MSLQTKRVLSMGRNLSSLKHCLGSLFSHTYVRLHSVLVVLMVYPDLHSTHILPPFWGHLAPVAGVPSSHLHELTVIHNKTCARMLDREQITSLKPAKGTTCVACKPTCTRRLVRVGRPSRIARRALWVTICRTTGASLTHAIFTRARIH